MDQGPLENRPLVHLFPYNAAFIMKAADFFMEKFFLIQHHSCQYIHNQREQNNIEKVLKTVPEIKSGVVCDLLHLLAQHVIDRDVCKQHTDEQDPDQRLSQRGLDSASPPL